jgi:hypothetical protein
MFAPNAWRCPLWRRLFALSLTASRGPEGRQRVAHGESRGIEERPRVVQAPEGQQIPSHYLCRPSGAADMNAVRGPTAYAVGYFLAPLCGSRSPRVCRLTLMGRWPGLG